MRNPTENSLVTNQMGNPKYKHIPFHSQNQTRVSPNRKEHESLSLTFTSVRFIFRRKIVNMISILTIGKEPKIQFSEHRLDTEIPFTARTKFNYT